MKNESLGVSAKVATTLLALESLRTNDTAQALELLELDLDASVIALARLAKDAGSAEDERVTNTFHQIRAYRRAHPRRVEADLGSLASNFLVRAAHLGRERARKILED